MRHPKVIMMFTALLFMGGVLSTCNYDNSIRSDAEVAKEEAVIDFLNLKFGMFIHYNMGTYHAEQWAYPFHDPRSFTPSKLDCNQWAAAAKSAGMRYGVLTAKHHDGFCLWDSKTTNYDIASSDKPYQNLDVVKEYADAFRRAGLKVGLYFSVWDRHQGLEKGKVNSDNIQLAKSQLTELLTNYGEIICIVIDGWGSVWGKSPDFDELPYDILADHIHSIQPQCLVINHSCRVDMTSTQLVHYEATHGQHIPYDNTYPSQQGPVLQPTWFWERGYEKLPLKPVKEIVAELHYTNKYYCNYLLNAAPNDKGLMDANVVARLAEVGRAIELSEPIKQLPKMHEPHRDVTVTVSSTDKADGVMERGMLDCNLYTMWRSDKSDAKPVVELDFGRPETFNCLSMHGGKRKSIQGYVVEAYVDGAWQEIVKGGVVAYNTKLHFEDITAQRYRLRVLNKRGAAELVEMTFVKY